MPSNMVRVAGVTCPRCGPKEGGGLLIKGVVTPFPFVIEQRRIEAAMPLCFECRANGIRRRCVVLMEPVGEGAF